MWTLANCIQCTSTPVHPTEDIVEVSLETQILVRQIIKLRVGEKQLWPALVIILEMDVMGERVSFFGGLRRFSFSLSLLVMWRINGHLVQKWWIKRFPFQTRCVNETLASVWTSLMFSQHLSFLCVGSWWLAVGISAQNTSRTADESTLHYTQMFTHTMPLWIGSAYLQFHYSLCNVYCCHI